MNKLIFLLCGAASITLGVGVWLGYNKEGVTISLNEKIDKDPLPEYLKGRYVREYYKPNAQWVKAEEADFGVLKIYETSGSRESVALTEAQANAAKNLQFKAFENAKDKGWFDYREGVKAGYRIVDDIDVLHYVNSEYVLDDKTLDPRRPEVLMYYPTKAGIRLLGVMFLSVKMKSPAEQIGGQSTLWHVHKWSKPEQCWVAGIPKPYDVSECKIKDGIVSNFSPEMLHVWFVMHPGGPFSTDMCVPAEVIDEQNIAEYLLKIKASRKELINLQEEVLSNGK